ncbi:DNA-entry nuclease [Bacillus sp. FJAT-52991]|uniref:DNA-entry nuclease n=1 Tax=Bacillus kandeliae TaxID=3129297 RepID=A0ABZ2N9W1_9BACI
MELVSNQPIEFDVFGRMKFHPAFHQKHGQPYSESDLEYLCKYWETDGMQLMALALGRPEGAISTKVAKLKKNGRFDYYKNLNKHW